MRKYRKRKTVWEQTKPWVVIAAKGLFIGFAIAFTLKILAALFPWMLF